MTSFVSYAMGRRHHLRLQSWETCSVKGDTARPVPRPPAGRLSWRGQAVFRTSDFESVGWYTEQATKGEVAEQAAPKAVFYVRYPPVKSTVRHEFTRAKLAAEIKRFKRQGWGVPEELLNALNSLRREGG